MSSQRPTLQMSGPPPATSTRPTASTAPEAMRPVVFIVDADPRVRRSLESMICSAGWHARSCASAQELLEHPPLAVPSCLVLDVSLPDINGLELQRRIAADRASMPLVFVTDHRDVPTAVRAMKDGAVDFLTRPCDDADLLRALKDGLERSRAALLRDAEIGLLRERHSSLTPREREVMTLVAAGLLNKLVGAQLAISEITVKAHRRQVMRKMQARSLADLVTMAAKLGQA